MIEVLCRQISSDSFPQGTKKNTEHIIVSDPEQDEWKDGWTDGWIHWCFSEVLLECSHMQSKSHPLSLAHAFTALLEWLEKPF